MVLKICYNQCMAINNFKKYFKFGIFGGFAGGFIAFLGYLILSPETNSVFIFLSLRVLIGAIVAMSVGPVITTVIDKRKSN